MATFMLHWEKFGKMTDKPQELENWYDCYDVFSGSLHKTLKQVKDYIVRIKTEPEYGKTRRYRIYKLIEVVE